MQRHEEAYLAVINPLSNAIPRALLDTRHQRAIIDDTVEHLPACRIVRTGMRLGAVARVRTLAIAAHLAR